MTLSDAKLGVVVPVPKVVYPVCVAALAKAVQVFVAAVKVTLVSNSVFVSGLWSADAVNI